MSRSREHPVWSKRDGTVHDDAPPGCERHQRRSRRERLYGHRLREVDRHPRPPSGASWGYRWAFDRLYEYVAYEPGLHAIDVEQVDPENTSRRCSHCGFTYPDNRGGEEFAWLKCGYENHANHNSEKHWTADPRWNQTGVDRGVLADRRFAACHRAPFGEHTRRCAPESRDGERERRVRPTYRGVRPGREPTRKPHPRRSERRRRSSPTAGRGPHAAKKLSPSTSRKPTRSTRTSSTTTSARTARSGAPAPTPTSCRVGRVSPSGTSRRCVDRERREPVRRA
jgi:hypothetical protein